MIIRKILITLLIAPEGIEILYAPVQAVEVSFLLIAPEGIEIVSPNRKKLCQIIWLLKILFAILRTINKKRELK